MTKLLYFPLQKKYKSVTGAATVGTPIRLFVETDAKSCVFCVREDGSPCKTVCNMQPETDGFSCEYTPQKPGLYFYCFQADGIFFGLDETDYSAAQNGTEFHLTVTANSYATPNKFKGGTIYQIFPDRFAKVGESVVEDGKILRDDWGGTPSYLPVNGIVKNNDFFGGNIAGIRSKLDYLSSLGVTALYLNPIFHAASNHRYDTGDYEAIDPMLGTEKDFAEFLSDCKSRGISVVLDGVFNHTGDDSKYFNKYGKYPTVGAYQSQESPYYAWYDFHNYPEEYAAWWGIKILPAVNDNNKDFISYITGENGILAKWQKLGVDGWRLDVADELSDEFIRHIRSRVKAQDENALLIGEVWEEADDKIAYSVRRKYFQGEELDGVMNYPLKNAILSAVQNEDFTAVCRVMNRLVDRYPKCSLDVLWNSLSTHDTYRVLTALSGVVPQEKSVRSDYKMSQELRQKAIIKEKFAAVMQFTLPGIPCLYYGDEIGMEGYEDPFNRKCFPQGVIEENELLFFYKKLATLRKKSTVFAEGEYRCILCEKGTFLYERRTESDCVIVALNQGGTDYALSLSTPMKNIFDGKTVTNYSLSRGEIAVFVAPEIWGEENE